MLIVSNITGRCWTILLGTVGWHQCCLLRWSTLLEYVSSSTYASYVDQHTSKNSVAAAGPGLRPGQTLCWGEEPEQTVLIPHPDPLPRCPHGLDCRHAALENVSAGRERLPVSPVESAAEESKQARELRPRPAPSKNCTHLFRIEYFDVVNGCCNKVRNWCWFGLLRKSIIAVRYDRRFKSKGLYRKFGPRAIAYT